jgi:hypothetical protein
MVAISVCLVVALIAAIVFCLIKNNEDAKQLALAVFTAALVGFFVQLAAELRVTGRIGALPVIDTLTRDVQVLRIDVHPDERYTFDHRRAARRARPYVRV